MATDFLFSGDDILSFIFFFWKPLLQVEGAQSFYLKHLVSARRNRFLFFFFQALIRMEVALRSSEIAFFRKCFVLASGNEFLINCKLYASMRSFSLLVDTILEIRCQPIFFYFFLFLTYQRRQFFWLVEMNFL